MDGVDRRGRKPSVVGGCQAGRRRLKAETLCGHHVEVYWKRDLKWYSGQVDSFVRDSDNYIIRYDDGQTETLHLEDEIWRLLKVRPGDRTMMTWVFMHPSSLILWLSQLLCSSCDSSFPACLCRTRQATQLCLQHDLSLTPSRNSVLPASLLP